MCLAHHGNFPDLWPAASVTLMDHNLAQVNLPVQLLILFSSLISLTLPAKLHFNHVSFKPSGALAFSPLHKAITIPETCSQGALNLATGPHAGRGNLEAHTDLCLQQGSQRHFRHPSAFPINDPFDQSDCVLLVIPFWKFVTSAVCRMSGRGCKIVEQEVQARCVLRLGACPCSYPLIGLWQERLAEVNSGKRIYHSAVAPNAFQMMCPWDARLLLSLSPPARNSPCNYITQCADRKRSCWLLRTMLTASFSHTWKQAGVETTSTNGNMFMITALMLRWLGLPCEEFLTL